MKLPWTKQAEIEEAFRNHEDEELTSVTNRYANGFFCEAAVVDKAKTSVEITAEQQFMQQRGETFCWLSAMLSC